MAEEKQMRRREDWRWNPAHWTDTKVYRYIRHVLKHAHRSACEILGGHEGRLVVAQIQARRNEILSRVMLAELGVKTIGEVERAAGEHTETLGRAA